MDFSVTPCTVEEPTWVTFLVSASTRVCAVSLALPNSLPMTSWVKDRRSDSADPTPSPEARRGDPLFAPSLTCWRALLPTALPSRDSDDSPENCDARESDDDERLSSKLNVVPAALVMVSPGAASIGRDGLLEMAALIGCCCPSSFPARILVGWTKQDYPPPTPPPVPS